MPVAQSSSDPEGALPVLVAADDLSGGTGVHLQSLARPLRSVGVETSFLCFGPFQLVVDETTAVAFGPPKRWFDRYPLAQLRRLAHLWRFVRATRPAVVHAIFFWPIMYGRLLKALGVVRVLVENREDQGFNWYRHEYMLLRATSGIPDRVICVSNAVRDVVLEREGIAADRVVVIHNGIDLPEPSMAERHRLRAALGFADTDVVVGMIANLNRPVKGVRYFIEAMPAIVEAVPGARFLIVGGGQDEAEHRCEAERLGVSDRVHFAGFQMDVTPFYHAMDVSVLTSLSEGLSITLLESMGHGLPVVVTAVGGNPEVVVDGSTGTLVPARDVPAFVHEVVRLAKAPELRAQYGAAGRQRVAAHFSRAHVAEQYARLYRDLVGQRPALPKTR